MHRHALRVYYEDTDLAGIVYYANYLKFLERGRTEALRALGIGQGRLRAETGLVFAVTRVALDYRRPARFDDWLEVETRVTALRAASVRMAQAVTRAGTVLCDGEVTVACIDAAGRPRRLPEEVRAALARMAGPAA
jgi:acyl-CoA thioester hydrolase